MTFEPEDGVGQDLSRQEWKDTPGGGTADTKAGVGWGEQRLDIFEELLFKT